MANARKLAVKALLEVHRNNAYSNITLNKILGESDASSADRALAAALFYGVLDRLLTLDYLLARFITKTPFNKISPLTKEALRIALYQIMYMDKIPESAAVNESVKIVKSSKERYNAAFVNGVLRAALRGDMSLPEGNDLNALSVRYSAPEWIVKSFLEDYGAETAVKLLEDSLKTPSVVLRVNTVKTTATALIEALKNENIKADLAQFPDALIIDGGIDVKNSECYKKGLFHIQDGASQLTVAKLGLKPGERVLDMCASPGGKTFTMAELMQNKGEILAFDLYEKRVQLIEKGAKRLGLDIIKAAVGDATEKKDDLGLFDAVLCDVPCSGLGVIRRKPDIKYKSSEDFSLLEDIQSKILCNAAGYLKQGGRLIYSTCTVRKSENQGIIKAFLDKNPGYELQYDYVYMPYKDNTDGFYCALVQKSR